MGYLWINYTAKGEKSKANEGENPNQDGKFSIFIDEKIYSVDRLKKYKE